MWVFFLLTSMTLYTTMSALFNYAMNVTPWTCVRFFWEYWEHDEASEGGQINYFAVSSEMALTSIAID